LPFDSPFIAAALIDGLTPLSHDVQQNLIKFSVRVMAALATSCAILRRIGAGTAAQKHVRPMAPSLMAQQVRANASKIAKAAFPRRS
jgi:hypothetical protein